MRTKITESIMSLQLIIDAIIFPPRETLREEKGMPSKSAKLAGFDVNVSSARQIAGTRRRANPLKRSRSTFQLANFINSAVASIFKTQGIQIHRQNCRRGLSRPHYLIMCKFGFCRIILQLLFTFAWPLLYLFLISRF